jgi:hypothetical protein
LPGKVCCVIFKHYSPVLFTRVLHVACLPPPRYSSSLLGFDALLLFLPVVSNQSLPCATTTTTTTRS